MIDLAPLILRLITVISLVVGAAYAAERAGSFWGSIIATAVSGQIRAFCL